jgi:hypothetical protein
MMTRMNTTRRGLACVTLAALSLAAAGCETEGPNHPRACTAIAIEALNVTVTDAATGQRICDALVTVTDGSFSTELRRFGGPSDCTHTGPTERPGRYEVRATRDGYATAVRSNVVVTADECHVIPVALSIALGR